MVLVTGGSSGIGLAAAHKFAEAGATTIICGREQEKLDAACAEAKAQGHAFIAYPVDLADMADCDRFVKLLIEQHGGVDYLINNAGRSIRRAIESSYDRFHDFERTMQLNYFGCLRVTMGLLPGMAAKRRGHVVNISSIGVLTNAPRFSAYVASKAALDAWTRCASSEFADVGITFTTINMPLVRTPMIAPTKIYNKRADAGARGGGRHDCAGLHLQAGAHRHPPGHHRPAAACAAAAGGADLDEHQLPHVPGLVGGQGRQERQAAALGRGDGAAADDAGHPLLKGAGPGGPAPPGTRVAARSAGRYSGRRIISSPSSTSPV